ncbi:Gfo/Idh/MocA family oxidoreductase [Glycomyces sp. TRM65418]|uniref:Gfo/Idh/MocA family protein n=1 Tax=Glycomyces sp. TRM65418 TaxID=2867006 RepID=UPI001CE6C3C3|nr:Gfo/Idh/MocA family oxidoreductase [Glycomyces sp. TRM65418]MCC3762226.1 Gfo/Idh/MocA family oxidoreductase [Glycomyces sp. TRM65418]QZD56285.1 Gfo/Idh/MocA family oxidoreductase [Glycomyces sp. TRM65418]
MTESIPRIALVGANGYGLHHRRNLEPRRRGGEIAFVGMCDTARIHEDASAPIGDIPVFDDYRAMLDATDPDVVIIATPPPTHLPIAGDAMRHGCDVYLEKPPVANLEEYAALYDVMTETGRNVQVGFQALGSHAFNTLRDAVEDGRLGDIQAVSVAGSWRRPDSYYRRSPWAGKREVNGVLVADGALANPFAHASQEAIALAGDWPLDGAIELERLRCREEIEVDDTAVWRATNRNGVRITVAVTLCGDRKIEGDIYVKGTEGEAWFEYPTDRLRLPGEAEPTQYGRTDLLENLLAHRRRGVGLISGLRRAKTFTGFLERVLNDPIPRLVDASHLERVGDDPVTILKGADQAVEDAARQGRLFSELGLPWA